MRIASLADPTTANGFYRAIGPMTTLAARGHVVHHLSPDKMDSHVSLLAHVDVLHIHRYADEHVLRLVRAARDRGVVVVWDNDDDTAAIPKGSLAYREQRRRGFDWHRHNTFVTRLLPCTDLVTTPSAVLAARFADYGAPTVRVIENYVPDEFCTRRVPFDDRITIGWLAGREHYVDVERVPIVPALRRIIEEESRVRVCTFGLRIGLNTGCYDHVPVVPFYELTEHLARIDIGIAPLADIAFNRARSNIKLKEYASASLPWLASPVGPYRPLGEEQGGRLVAATSAREVAFARGGSPRPRPMFSREPPYSPSY